MAFSTTFAMTRRNLWLIPFAALAGCLLPEPVRVFWAWSSDDYARLSGRRTRSIGKSKSHF